MKLGLFSVDWDANNKSCGASNWWRLVRPAQELARHDRFDIVLANGVQDAPDGHIRVQAIDGEWHDDCDLVVFQRWMAEGADKAARRAIACGQVIVNDVDDYYWALPRTNIAHTYSDPVRFPKYNREHYRRFVAASSAITVSTEYLRNALSRFGPPVHLVRNYVDTDLWEPRGPREPGCIGWVGGLPWRGNDLQLLRKSLVPFLLEHDLPFYHGGHVEQSRMDVRVASAFEQLGMPADRVATRPLCDIREYPSLWDPIAIAVIPLENTPFSAAKSWVKGLEACARGVPFVHSRHAEYTELGVGREASRPWQWRSHVEELTDPEVRAAEGKANRLRAEELSIQRNWHHWDEAYNLMLDRTAVAA